MSGGDLDLDEMGPVHEPSAEVHAAALKAVCAYAIDVDDAVALAQMLGLVPTERGYARCVDCGRAMARHGGVGAVTTASHGRCSGCYQARRREGGL